MLALIDAGIEVERYVAYEIDEYAIKTSAHNFGLIEHKGDVFEADFAQYRGFDYLIGGSPCTHWSITKKGREVVASGDGWNYFSQFVRAMDEAKPTFFVYENNKSMSSDIRDSISRRFGFEPVYINSNTTSAQHRQRLYWVGVRDHNGSYRRADIEDLDECDITLQDIVQRGLSICYPVNTVGGGKSYAIKRNYYKSSITNFINGGGHYPQTGVAERIDDSIAGYTIERYGKKYRIYTVSNGVISLDGNNATVDLPDGRYIIRKLTLSELKELQNVPEWYEFPVSETQAVKMLGNGWTVGVISHILEATKLCNT